MPTRAASASNTPPTIEKIADLSRHLLRAQEEERKRISRELHDETGQGLMLLRLYLGMLANTSESPEAFLRVQEAMELLDRTIGDLRRIIARLSPRILDEIGLLPAIRKEARELSKHAGIKAQFDLPKNLAGINHETEVAIYRSVQEALHNVAKHAKAKSVTIRLELEPNTVRLSVEDDGMGFSRNNGSSARSFGILGMRERIAALGGNVRIRSRKGRGTRLCVTLPILHAGSRKKSSKLETRVHGAARIRPLHATQSRSKNSSLAVASDFLKGTTQYPNVHQLLIS